MSKRKKRNHKTAMKIKKVKVKSRKTWSINPSTRVEPNDKKYNRRKAKREARKEIQCWK